MLEGTVQFKLDDEIMDLGPGHVVKCSPEVVRSVWNEGPEDVELIMCSVKADEADHVLHEDFWPE